MRRKGAKRGARRTPAPAREDRTVMGNERIDTLHEKNGENRVRYDITAWFYDILDYPWELR